MSECDNIYIDIYMRIDIAHRHIAHTHLDEHIDTHLDEGEVG